MLRTLGDLSLEGSTLRRPKPLLLLAHLVLEGAKSRRYLAELFFPDVRDPRDSLSTALYHLQEALGHALKLEGTGVAADTACDAAFFKALCETRDYEDALTLYLGSFFTDLPFRLSSELEEWLLGTREHLATLAREAHLALGERALRAGEARSALHHAETACLLPDAPPLEEAEARRLQRLLERTESALMGRFLRETASFGLTLTPPGSAPPHNLPTLLTGFVGRDPERLGLTKVLSESDGRLVTLHGPGGIGKTRLAIQVAADILREVLFEDGVFFLPLDILSAPSQLLPALAHIVGSEADEKALEQRLGKRRMLIVLDTFEHLLEAAPLLPRLLAACPNLSFIVTTRERLNLRAEWVLTLTGLALPEDEADVENALLTEAVQLFSLRAKRAQMTFNPATELASMLRICRAVEGFPLGIELAAAWVGAMPLAELADALEAGSTTLKTPLRDVRERHRSLEAALEHSWRLLDPAQQRLFLGLASFEGGFTSEAAAQVAGATSERLKELLDKALLERAGGRYRFHALTYAHARAKLARNAVFARTMKERHGRFYSKVLGQLNLEASGGASPELLAFMREEEGNLLAFLAWALEAKQYTRLAALAEPLLWHFPIQGRFGEASALCDRVLAALPADEAAARVPRAAFLASYSFIKLFAGNAAEAVQLSEEALELVRASTDTGSKKVRSLQELRALDVLGQAQTRIGTPEEATEQLRYALELARRYGDPVRLLRILTNLGIAYSSADKLDAALAVFFEGLELYRTEQVGQNMDVIALLTGLSFGQMLSDDNEHAVRSADEGLSLIDTLGIKGQRPILLAIRTLAELEQLLQHGAQTGFAEVAARCREFLPVTRLRGEVSGHIFLLATLARCDLEMGQLHEARELLGEANGLAWTRQNFMGFFCVLPYAVDLALTASHPELGGELAGFISASKQAGSWVRRRSERAVTQQSFSPEADKAFQGAVARGYTLTLEETVGRILEFTGQPKPTENP